MTTELPVDPSLVVTCAAFVGLIGINQPLAVRPPTSLLRLHILGLFVCFLLLFLHNQKFH